MPQELRQIAIDELMPDPSQPRKTFLADEIERLAASIRARGMLLPLRVVRDDERRAWRIVTGECRWRAARLAGLKLVPCIPVEGQPDEADLLADQIIENTVRNSLLPMELARSLGKLKSLKGCNSQTLATGLGISGSAITRAEALLSLPEAIQAMVDDGRVPESAGYEISRLPDMQAQLELATAIAAGKLNRDQVAEAVRSRVGKRNVQPKASRLACKLDGVSITVTAGQPLTWDSFNAAISRLSRVARKLHEGGQDITELSRSLRPS